MEKEIDEVPNQKQGKPSNSGLSEKFSSKEKYYKGTFLSSNQIFDMNL